MNIRFLVLEINEYNNFMRLSYLNLILDDVLLRYCYLFIIVFIVMDVNRMYI